MAPSSELREAIVLAGGRGTRLAPVVADRQKVSLEVAGQPMALRLVSWLAAAGIRKVVFAAGHLAADIQAIVEANADWPVELAVSVETEALGTAGAARLACGLTAADPLLVLNGDSFADIDLERFYAFHRSAGAKASIALVRAPEPDRYGLVMVDPKGAVTSFQEKPDRGGPGWINGGVYLFERAALLAVADRTEVSFEREVFPALAGRGLYAMKFDARFIDIGTPQSLQAAQSFFGAAER